MTQVPNIAVARYPGQHAKDEEVVTHARCGQLDNLPLILRDVIIAAVLLMVGNPLVGLLASLPPLAPYAWLAPAATATVVSLPLVHAVYCILWTATYRCTITNQRMIMRYGVFNPISDESELFRFRDYKVIQPWYCRPFKRGTVMFWTTDQANAQFALLATKRPVEVRNTVRRLAQEARQAEGVHVVE